MPTSPVPSRRKRRRWLWWVAAPFAAGTIAIVVAALVWDHRVDRRLADAIAAADRDDPRWRLADVLADRPRVPDAENSALVVVEALEFVPENWPDGPYPPPGYPKPPPSDAQRAYKSLEETPDNVLMRPGTARQLRSILDEVPEAVQIARTLADLPQGRHEIEFTPTFFDTRLPLTQATRHLARLLQADAVARANEGDIDGALGSCLAILNAGRSIGDEPTLISQLVRIAIGSMATQAARRVLALGEPSDEALAKFQAIVDDEIDQPLMLFGLKGERGTLDELIRKLGTGEVRASELSGSPSNDPNRPPARVSPWDRAMFAHQRAVELEWMTDAVLIARKPVADQIDDWKRWDDRFPATKKLWHSNYTALIPLLFSPGVSPFHVAMLRSRCELGAMSALLASERHRRKTGTWPASALDIDASLLNRPPLDPFGREPLRLEHRDGQLFVYSIGMNREDDHGRYDLRRWTTGPYDLGTSAWDVSLRRQAAPLPDLPANVFQSIPGDGSDAP